MRSIAIGVMLPILVAGGAAFANGDGYIMSDEINFGVSVETWVEAERPRVEVRVEAAVDGANVGALRSDIIEAVTPLAPDAEWRFTRLDRSEDSTGLERWRGTLEARVTPDVLDGLGGSLDDASQPGLQFRLGPVDYSPTLEELEAARRDLRGEIYDIAADELERIQASFPERDYRIGRIDFLDYELYQPQHYGYDAAPQMQRTMEMASDTAGTAQGENIPVSLLAEMNARVTYATRAYQPEERRRSPAQRRVD